MLSKQAIKFLAWMKKNNAWWHEYRLEQQYPGFDYRALSALHSQGYLDACVAEDEPPQLDEFGSEYYCRQYRINDRGIAYLEERSKNKWKEFRSWFSLVIALAAFIKSFFF